MAGAGADPAKSDGWELQLSIGYLRNAVASSLVEEDRSGSPPPRVPEKFRLGDYRRIGANPVTVEAANPNVYKQCAAWYDVTFVGQVRHAPVYIRRFSDAE